MKEQERAETENDQAMKLAPDEDLMLEVRNGSGETLGVLFDRYHAPLFNFYSKLTGDRTLSDDLVQEVFLRILKYRQSYEPGTPFRAWIYQIARNARVDHYRKTPRHITFEPEMAPPVMPKDSAQQSEEAELLHRALMQMPEEKREILVLSRFQELKYTRSHECWDASWAQSRRASIVPFRNCGRHSNSWSAGLRHGRRGPQW